MITAPRDREVICHASAWDVDNVEDLRIKMCTKVNADDFVTVHHELGHNFYQRAYNKQPLLYLDSANDGFHEAIGDTIALSVTPEYLVQIGLLPQQQGADGRQGYRPAAPPGDGQGRLPALRPARRQMALGVFSGEISPAEYQAALGPMRLQYQGIVPPSPRSERDFDPGAKYHVPASVPYTRYFLARILQFQFYQAACKQAGWTGPLHRCSFYGNKEVGRRLNAMLAMGASRPWPDALEAFTGTREMSAPSRWSNISGRCWAGCSEQNRGRQVRLAGLGLSLALAAALPAGPAAAEAPVSAQPLAPGEVLLELGAIGTVTTPADLATIMVRVEAEGESDVAAGAALRTRAQRVVDAARRAGVPAAAIAEGEVNAAPSDQAFDLADMSPPALPGATPAPGRTASTVIAVRVTDMGRLQAVRAALAEAGGADLPSASYALVDNGAARSAARAQALATVRADAEAYATALNMRVARIVRVTERTGVDMLGAMYSGGPTTRRLLGPEHDHGPDIPTVVMVGVDFALAPR